MCGQKTVNVHCHVHFYVKCVPGKLFICHASCIEAIGDRHVAGRSYVLDSCGSFIII